MTSTTMRTFFMKLAAASALLIAAAPAAAQEAETMSATVAGRVVAYDRAVEADTDDDGVNDRTTYYMGATMVMTAYDEDQDGRQELWFFYDENERVSAEASDTDGDGSADQVVAIGPDERVAGAPTDAATDDDAGASLMLPLIAAAIVVIGVMAALRPKREEKEKKA